MVSHLELVLTISTFVVIICAIVFMLVTDKRDRRRQFEYSERFDEECREFWRKRCRYPIVPPEE